VSTIVSFFAVVTVGSGREVVVEGALLILETTAEFAPAGPPAKASVAKTTVANINVNNQNRM
jgi:hypothetical protein